MLTNRYPVMNRMVPGGRNAFLGQWNQPMPTPAGTAALECYKCGMQGYRQMTASMAAQVPGGCQKVDPSFCGQQPAPTTGTTPTNPNPWGAPQAPGGGLAMNSPAWQGPTHINLTVFEPQELKPFKGAKVTVDLFDFAHSTDPVNVPFVQRNVFTGETDADGKFYFAGQAPTPNRNYRWRLTVTPGAAGPGFPSTYVDVPARTAVAESAANSAPEEFKVATVVCPSGTDALVCAVAQAQVSFVQLTDQALAANHYEDSGKDARILAYAVTQAANFVGLNHPRLQAQFNTYKWWIGNLAVPPKAWPKMMDNYEQLLGVFNKIPFPRPGNTDLFIRCARGIPLWKMMNVARQELYLSDYFPRENRRIEADMAFSYVVSLNGIIECMIKKIEEKAREIQKHQMTMKMIGLGITFMLAPIAGLAGFTSVLSDATQLLVEKFTGKGLSTEQSTLVTAGVAVASADPAALEKLLAAGITALTQQFGDGMNPALQNAINTAVPKVVTAAVQDQVAGILGTSSTSGALDFASLTSLGSAAAAIAIKLFANMIVASGAKSVKAFENLLMDIENLPALLVPFVTWAINVLLLDQLFNLAAQQAGQDMGTAPGGGNAPVGGAAPGTTPGTTPGTAPGGTTTGPTGGASVPTGVAPGDRPIQDLNMSRDIVDPMVGRAESQGVEVPRDATRSYAPVIASSDPLATAAGVGVVGILALAVAGVFG